MKNMKKITMIATVFFALAFVAAFADTAMAKPNWLGVKITSWEIHKSNDKYYLRVSVRHTNDNDERVITNIYNKTGKFTLKRPFTYKGRKTTAFTVLTLKSAKNNAVDMAPGESFTLTYNLHIPNVDNGLKGVVWYMHEVHSLLESGGWQLTYSYDCEIKSELERRGRGRR